MEKIDVKEKAYINSVKFWEFFKKNLKILLNFDYLMKKTWKLC